MSPYRIAHPPAVRREPSLALRVAMRVAEFWLAQDCKNLRWYRRAVGGAWVKKMPWWDASGHRWERVGATEEAGMVSKVVTEEWP